MYANIKPLCSTFETNIVLHGNYIAVFKKLINKMLMPRPHFQVSDLVGFEMRPNMCLLETALQG